MRVAMHERVPSDAVDAGDYWLEKRADGSEFPVIICPKCIKPGRCSNHILVQRSPLTIRASFLCHQSMPDGTGTCGWHGWVTDGAMSLDQ